jgi:hypothetical protein
MELRPIHPGPIFPHPFNVTVDIGAGSTNFPLSEMNDSLNVLNMAELSFINGNDTVDTVFVNSLSPPTQFIEATFQEPNAGENLTITGGVNISDAFLNLYMQPGTSLTLDGNSEIAAPNNVADASSSLNLTTNGLPDPLGTTLTLNGTITLGPLGQNILALEDVNTVGGTVIETGTGDLIHLGANFAGSPDEGIGTTTGTDFQIRLGVVTMTGTDGFGGTFGPIGSYSNAPALGFGALIEIYNASAVTSGGFDTSTGMLSLFNAAGTDVGDMHFAGNASGLTLTQTAADLIIRDVQANNPQGNIPLTFHA